MAPVRAAARHGLPDRSIMPLARRLVRRAAMAVAAALGMLPVAPTMAHVAHVSASVPRSSAAVRTGKACQ